MDDQRIVQPSGLLENLHIKVGSEKFKTSFLILDVQGAYSMLLGQPWLKSAGAVQVYANQMLTIQEGNNPTQAPTKTGQTNGSEKQKSTSSTITANTKEALTPSKKIYEYYSNDEVDSNPTTEVAADKETKAMAKRKSGMPNWLLPNPQEVEEWNLGSEEDPKMIKINKHSKKELKDKAWNLLLKFKDVFAWEHTDLKEVDPEVCQHRIPLKPNAIPIRQQRYKMNPNYAKKVKEEIDNLLKAGFITKVESSDWLFTIVIVPKKDGKLRVCVDYRKLNSQTIKDPFPLPFTDMMLDEIAWHEMYSFMVDYSGYNQLKIAPEDREKTIFITVWRAFMYLVMPFGLCNAPTTF
ncbi:hypothetical protein L7F22_043221 [Adiantum nelumboides]|nr:hypothetical protein [Adiantum nelumboides]